MAQPEQPKSHMYGFLGMMLIFFGIACSYGLALIGEPQSVWLWKLVGVL